MENARNPRTRRRADARFCSTACRTREYRHRKAQAQALADSREVDLEVKKPITEVDETAASSLREHRTSLDAVVRLLLEREVVEGDEVRRLFASELHPPLLVTSAPPRVDAA